MSLSLSEQTTHSALTEEEGLEEWVESLKLGVVDMILRKKPGSQNTAININHSCNTTTMATQQQLQHNKN